MTATELKERLRYFPRHEAGILGRDKMFNAAVLIPFCEIDGALHVVFEKRTQHIRQGGEISFPGGAYDAHENDAAVVATRECSEELGLEEEKIHILGRMDSLVSPKKLIIDACIGWLDINSIKNLAYNKDEVETLFSLPFNFFVETKPHTYHTRFTIHSYKENTDGTKEILFPAKELGIPEVYHESWGETLHTIYVYETPYGPLWGFTAEFMVELVQNLQH